MATQAGLSLERPQQAEGFEMGAPMSMAEDLVKRLRTHMVVHTTDLGDYGTHSTGYVDPDCEAAADLIEQQSATIAAKDEEIERLRAADPRTSLLTVIADIREKTGVGGKPMLNELADAIAAEIDRRVADEREKCNTYRNALLWTFDRLSVTGGMNANEQRRTMREIGNVLTGRGSPAATYQPNDWDDSAAAIRSQEAGR